MSEESGGERPAPEASTAEQPQLLATSLGDQCANCGARLAGDQRYCVECGERRGKPRYALAGDARSAGSTGATGARGAPRAPLDSRLSANGALIGGVATLLLAMAVGLLIGLNVNNSTPARSPAVQYIPTPSASAPSTSTTASAPSSTAASGTTKSTKTKTKGKVSITAAAKLPAAAKKIPKKLQSAVAKPGSKCAGGGKFTGTYFGAGASRSGCSK